MKGYVCYEAWGDINGMSIPLLVRVWSLLVAFPDLYLLLILSRYFLSCSIANHLPKVHCPGVVSYKLDKATVYFDYISFFFFGSVS